MALNFTVSYTFSPNTTISSSQVNTNFSDIAGVFQGLEAETKTLAKLKVDIDPTLALEVATKQYVDHYSTYRRPVLQYGSVTTVAVESGLDGTSGDIPLLFPDGTVRTETSTTRTTFDITRNAVLVTSGAQSGLTGATSEAASTWYALYGCKVTDSSTQWVTVGSTVLPLRANFSTLNTAYGVSGWVYLGLIRNGNGGDALSDILSFKMAGNTTLFDNSNAGGHVGAAGGLTLTGSAGSTNLNYSYSAGTGAAQIPNNITLSMWVGIKAAAAGEIMLTNGITNLFRLTPSSGITYFTGWGIASDGVNSISGNSVAGDIAIVGFVDGVLGVGSNPIL